MKQAITAVAMLLLSSQYIFSQGKFSDEFVLSKSTPFTVVDALSKKYFVVEGGFSIAVKTEDQIVNIQKFDANEMKQVKKKTYEDLPKGAVMQDVVQMGQRIFFIYELYDKKGKRFDVFSREVLIENCVLKRPVKMFSTSRKAVYNYKEFGEVPKGMGYKSIRGKAFEVVLSNDQSKLVVRYRLSPISRNDSENYDEIGFQVFDLDMTKIWGKEQRMPHTEAEMNNVAFALANNGMAYMLAGINSDNSMELMRISQDDFSTTPIELDRDLVARELQFLESKDGSFTCTGFFSESLKAKYSTGVFHFKFDANGGLIHSSTHKFPLELVQQYVSNKEKKKAEKREDKEQAGIDDLRLNEIHLQDDGSIFLLSEAANTYTVQRGNSTSLYWSYRNGLAMKIGNDGELQWIVKIPKNQKGSKGSGGMSFKYVPGKTHHYLLYLDHIENQNLSLEEVPEMHKDELGGILTAFKIEDSTGDAEKESIFNVRDFKGKEIHQFATSRIMDLEPNVFLLETYIKGKKDMMVKMELKE